MKYFHFSDNFVADDRLGRREKQNVRYQTITAPQSMVCNLKSGILFLTSSLRNLDYKPFRYYNNLRDSRKRSKIYKNAALKPNLPRL
jgi:hypothetical protein